MSRTFDERRKMEKRQDDNRAANERAKDQIAEYKGDHATGLDIVKFKLYQEQDGVCLYSGQNLRHSPPVRAGLCGCGSHHPIQPLL